MMSRSDLVQMLNWLLRTALSVALVPFEIAFELWCACSLLPGLPGNSMRASALCERTRIRVIPNRSFNVTQELLEIGKAT